MMGGKMLRDIYRTFPTALDVNRIKPITTGREEDTDGEENGDVRDDVCRAYRQELRKVVERGTC
jgi:hypothetical protein